jgi:hypothetical protein
MKKITLLLFLTIMIIKLPAQNMNQENWRSFEDVAYTIHYPENWDLNTSGQNNTSFILVAQSTDDNGVFKENINLLINPLPNEKINLDYFAKASEMQVAKAFEKSSLIKSVRVRTENGEYQNMVYTGERNGIQLKFMQRYWVIDAKAYILTFSSNERKFDDYIKEVEAIFDSFTFK